MAWEGAPSWSEASHSTPSSFRSSPVKWSLTRLRAERQVRARGLALREPLLLLASCCDPCTVPAHCYGAPRAGPHAQGRAKPTGHHPEQHRPQRGGPFSCSRWRRPRPESVLPGKALFPEREPDETVGAARGLRPGHESPTRSRHCHGRPCSPRGFFQPWGLLWDQPDSRLPRTPTSGPTCLVPRAFLPVTRWLPSSLGPGPQPRPSSQHTRFKGFGLRLCNLGRNVSGPCGPSCISPGKGVTLLASK